MTTPTPSSAHQRRRVGNTAPPIEDEFVLKLRRYMAGTINGHEGPLSAEIGARALHIATRLKELLGTVPFVSSADADSASIEVPLDTDRTLYVEVTEGFIEAVTYSDDGGITSMPAGSDDELLRRVAVGR